MIDRIERLTPHDLPACLALAEDREWLPEEHKWRLLFAVGTVYGLRDDAGDLVGTTVLTRYGNRLAAISMVLVATRYGRRGLGRRLMAHALGEAGDATVFLNATRHGRPLYEKLGFVRIGATHTHVGPFEPTDPAGTSDAGPGDLAAMLRLDAEVCGADRGHVVRRLPDFAERIRVVRRQGIVSGFAGAWRNVDNVVIGPVIARDETDARALMGDIAATVDGPVRLDLDGRHPGLREWAARRGVPESGSTTVMAYGAPALPGDRDRWFVPLMQALG
ncbi:GNAT family N-acetyltransferase [Rugosimonospora africana]|uniref:Acetyltransferase n=1 Tax=Rugosimonospora africana TaxID=556532 RepID=A0A8J3VW51_9ACTN|nr:GNAT family N-acetyltransferase [Rugosimonospora africana]GIH20368.1 acetyltransferase [Rugosimonospora africana]